MWTRNLVFTVRCEFG